MPTPKPLLIIITGLTCTGKTTLAKHIAAELRLPLIYKDGIKECLFDDLGWTDRHWSRKLGQATYSILFHIIEAQLAAGSSLIVESNFSPTLGTPNFLAIQRQYDFEPLQILCVADGETLFQRFKHRSESGERHPGHSDHLIYDEAQPLLLQGRLAPLDIGGSILEIDTTDFTALDYKKIIETIKHMLP